MKYFKKNWPTDLQSEVVAMAQNIVCFPSNLFTYKTNRTKFKERYEHMYSGSNATAPHPTSGAQDSDYDMSDDDDCGDLTKHGSLNINAISLLTMLSWRGRLSLSGGV